jgi:transcriptional accessory protein Tex/SPT6
MPNQSGCKFHPGFATNLGQLLLAPPLGEKVLAIDPGFRSGCKMYAWMKFIV